MLSALILILPGFSLQESLPHPTLPVRSGTWPPATAKVDSSRAWVCLNPSWMPQATEDGKERRFLPERNSRGRIAQRLMQSEGWTEAEAGAWMRAAAPGAVALEFALTRGDEILFSGREIVTPGIPMVVSDLLKGGGIADIDVEIAQGSVIGDPLGADIWSGTSLGLQLFAVAGQGWQAEVALAAGMGAPAEEMDFGNAQIGGKKRLRGRLLELGFTTLLTPGGEGNRVTLTGSEGAIELLLAVQGEVPSIIPAGKAGFAIPVPGPRWEGVESGPWTLIEGSDAQVRAESFAARIAENCIAKSTTLALMVPSEENDSRGATLSGSFIQRHPIRFAVGGYFDALTGWDVEVATGARIGDPRFNTFFSGACGEIWVRKGIAHLDIEIRAAGVLDEMTSTVLLAGKQPGGSFERGETSGLPREEVRVEHPFEKILRFKGDYPMAQGENGERLELSRSARILLGSAHHVRVVLETGA